MRIQVSVGSMHVYPASVMTSKVCAQPSADCSCTVVPSGRTCGCGIIGTVIGQF